MDKATPFLAGGSVSLRPFLLKTVYKTVFSKNTQGFKYRFKPNIQNGGAIALPFLYGGGEESFLLIFAKHSIITNFYCFAKIFGQSLKTVRWTVFTTLSH